MKVLYAALVFLAELRKVVALPATTVASHPAVNSVTPSPSFNPPCQALCIQGYQSVYDPTTKKCTCVPDNTKEHKCLSETICIEYDTPMAPVWDAESRRCICEPRNDDKFICIAATTCLPGSSPYWNSATKKCNCLKTKPVSSISKRNSPSIISLSRTAVITPTPAPTVDSCTFLKIFCECGDHHQHWSEEKQACQCPPCPPVVSLGCENLMIYCNEGDHRMHWNPATKKCECPVPTISVSNPAKRAQAVPEIVPSKQSVPSVPTTAPRVDTCPLLKMLCPCGDRHLHWNEELQQCACQPCEPPQGVVCENLKIYCNDGDHKMHWDPVTAKCQCLIPMVTDYAPEPLPTI
ncbi:hypothetical protein BKA65DRAFT_477306 [Rhexocercosporidium sp. MPI-PUGE-AT-0058]|nr:hypothetical protein BKA65DRAFT_477306 [Rhexocercosporidium sp. MPI-PUGE-AT-0058]